MKKLTLFVLSFSFCLASIADFKILKSAKEFNDLVQSAKVPVIVQFSAYWCGPCQELSATFTQLAKEFSDDKVLLAYVDAYEIKELGTFVQGGYPTVRTFMGGKLVEKSFVGSNSDDFVRDFINSVIAHPEVETEGGFCRI